MKIRKLFGKLPCKWNNHGYALIRKVSNDTDHIGCVFCKRQWGINHSVKCLVPWREVEFLYSDKK